MEKISDKLINLLRDEKVVFIQTHDFPDPDAIAAAFGLQYFLKELGITSAILYEGELQTNPVESMVEDLGISMKNIDEVNINADDKIILIDSCKGNKNVTNQKGKIIAVIDHHQGGNPANVFFVDIRSNYGSCATIVSFYMQEQDIKLTSKVATALAIGIHIDTNSFRRRTHQRDIEAISFLYKEIDQIVLGTILRNNIFQDDLMIYQKAIASIKIHEHFAFYYYPNKCSQNLLGILADFFLAIEEVDFVVLCAHQDQKIIFSIRSENFEWNAGLIVKAALKNLGTGGGHQDMAGGIIKDSSLFNEKDIYQKFKKQLRI